MSVARLRHSAGRPFLQWQIAKSGYSYIQASRNRTACPPNIYAYESRMGAVTLYAAMLRSRTPRQRWQDAGCMQLSPSGTLARIWHVCCAHCIIAFIGALHVSFHVSTCVPLEHMPSASG